MLRSYETFIVRDPASRGLTSDEETVGDCLNSSGTVQELAHTNFVYITLSKSQIYNINLMAGQLGNVIVLFAQKEETASVNISYSLPHLHSLELVHLGLEF